MHESVLILQRDDFVRVHLDGFGRAGASGKHRDLEVAGHDLGEEVTPPEQVVRYMQALASAAPERTLLIRHAESWEGRPLMALVLGAPECMARLQEIQTGLRRLADLGGLSDAEAEGLIAELPVVTALLHGIHGNEVS